MIKTKTFIANTNKVNPYLSVVEDYVPNTERFDEIVNEFISTHNVVDIKVVTHVQGNNPPTSFIEYIITYEED